MTEVFLDTAYAIALAAPTDDFHQRALALADYLEENRIDLITTRGILLEIGNALAKRRYRAAAVALLDSLENDAIGIRSELWKACLKLCMLKKNEDK